MRENVKWAQRDVKRSGMGRRMSAEAAAMYVVVRKKEAATSVTSLCHPRHVVEASTHVALSSPIAREDGRPRSVPLNARGVRGCSASARRSVSAHELWM